jgi:hypothetical protein
MKFSSPSAITYLPNGGDVSKALESATHLSVGAHPDDIEIMSFHGVQACLGKNTFVGVVVSDGGGSARSGEYLNTSDEEMIRIRQSEQKKSRRSWRLWCAYYAESSKFGS